MVKRHWNAQAVLIGEVHCTGCEKGIVHDIAMAQRCALGQAGRAAGELDVDCLIRIECPGDGIQACGRSTQLGFEQLVEAEHPRLGGVSGLDQRR